MSASEWTWSHPRRFIEGKRNQVVQDPRNYDEGWGLANDTRDESLLHSLGWRPRVKYDSLLASTPPIVQEHPAIRREKRRQEMLSRGRRFAQNLPTALPTAPYSQLDNTQPERGVLRLPERSENVVGSLMQPAVPNTLSGGGNILMHPGEEGLAERTERQRKYDYHDTPDHSQRPRPHLRAPWADANSTSHPLDHPENRPLPAYEYRTAAGESTRGPFGLQNVRSPGGDRSAGPLGTGMLRGEED